MSLAVPHPTLFEEPIAFSAHEKLPGDHLVTSQYLALSQPARDRLADRLGLFYAQLHALPQDEMTATRRSAHRIVADARHNPRACPAVDVSR